MWMWLARIRAYLDKLLNPKPSFTVRGTGHLKVWKRFSDGERELIFDQTNQLTYAYMERILEMLAQRATDPAPVENQVFSVWWETNPTDISAPSPSDTSYSAGSTIVAQKTFSDAQKISVVSGNKRILELRSTLESDEGNGLRVVAVNLFSKGDGTPPEPPNPVGFVGGTNNVHLYARQKIGPFPKTDDFALDINWGLTLEIAT